MSTIIADNLTGKTSAGSITVTSEGGAVTFQMQQGLAKCWLNYNHNTPVVDDSFSISSVTDNATGNFSPAYSNSFNSADYAMAGMACNTVFICMEDNRVETTQTTTSSTKLLSMDTAGAQSDQEQIMVKWHGDLA